jgi:ribosomal protein S18 acetylase RimI-like enzyme
VSAPGPELPTVRRLRAEEWAELRELRLQALRTDPLAFGSTLARELDFPESRWREWAERGANSTESSTWVAADRSGRFLGIAVLAFVDGGWNVFSMWMAPEARGLGVGSRLLDSALAWLAADRPEAPVRLLVNPRQAAAVALYRSRGFLPTGRAEPLGHSGEERTEEFFRRPPRDR